MRDEQAREEENHVRSRAHKIRTCTEACQRREKPSHAQ
jgi:hypothetical protein